MKDKPTRKMKHVEDNRMSSVEEEELHHGAEEEAGSEECSSISWTLLAPTRTSSMKRIRKKGRLKKDVTLDIKDSVIRDRNGEKREQLS